MANIKFAFDMAGNTVESAISSIAKRSATLTRDVQFTAVSILHELVKHNDTGTAAKRANLLVAALGKGMRATSLQRWFESNAPFVFNKETKELVFGSTAASPVRKVSDIDLVKCRDAAWQDAEPMQEYKPIADFGKLVLQLIKKAETDREKLGDASKVDPVMLDTLKALTVKAA